MLHSLFPRCHCKFTSLPILGATVDGFDDWLASSGYTRGSRKFSIRMLRHVDVYLRRHGVHKVASLNHGTLYACWRDLIKIFPTSAGTVRTLERYLVAKDLITHDCKRTALAPTVALSEQYANHLREVQGFSVSTVSSHLRTAECFLEHLKKTATAVGRLAAPHIESYIAKAGKRLSRGSLQHDIAALRGFLRFLIMVGKIPAGLKYPIDTPRLYRLERLPRALPWTTVRALLRSMEKTSPMGLRDYAIFLLIATYGLRASEIVAITVDDIRWREGILHIHQRKTSSPLELPLTNEVLSALVKHLKRTPPPTPYRRVFLRMRAPIGALKPTAVGEAFQALVRKSGLSIPYQGPHCLRHSYAVHLLKSGTPLKTIGDILGHRTAESTCMYLRLATGDLREVALQVPSSNKRKEGQR
ncbi:MAG TPA: tyrosine-type recombinase/integrase [Candidatus Sulfotelmatobacter sp.]|nr:tyrosine-type recombinase/integrase [Candidatus Sulfotelmatobacter sp.]